MLQFLYNIADVVWLPIAWGLTHPGQKSKAILFILTCMFMLRLQVEFLESTGYANGFTNILTSPPYQRGLVIYGLFIMIFILLSYFSPNTKGVVYMAAGLSIFIIAFCSSMAIMAL